MRRARRGVGVRIAAVTTTAVLAGVTLAGCAAAGDESPRAAAPTAAPAVGWLDGVCHAVTSLAAAIDTFDAARRSASESTDEPFATLRSRVQAGAGALAGPAQTLVVLLETPTGIAGSSLVATRDALQDPARSAQSAAHALGDAVSDSADTRTQAELAEVAADWTAVQRRIEKRADAVADVLHDRAGADAPTAESFAQAPACAPYRG